MIYDEDAFKCDDRRIVTTGLQPDPGDVGVGRTYRVTGHIKEFRRREELGCFFT